MKLYATNCSSGWQVALVILHRHKLDKTVNINYIIYQLK